MGRTIRWAAAAASAVVVVSAIAVGFSSMDLITVRLPRDGDRLAIGLPVPDEQTATLSYRHSVEKTAIEARFRIGEDATLQIAETRTTSTGTGLPNIQTADTMRQGNWIVTDEHLKDVDGFRFFIMPVNRSCLATGQTRIDLSTLPPGTLVTLNAERIHKIRWYLWRHFQIAWPPKTPESGTDP